MVRILVDSRTLVTLCLFLFSLMEELMSRKSVKYKGEKVIKILKLLSKHVIQNESCVMKYLDILLSFLDPSVKDSGIYVYSILFLVKIV